MRDSRGEWSGNLPRLFWVYAAFASLCALLVALRPLNFLSDDCLFYLVIADHVSKGEGSTFNGLFPTNGYHPLWEYLASALALLPHTKPALLAYGVAMQLVLAMVTLWLLLRALRPFFGAQAMAAFLAVMLFFFVPFGNLYWTEAPLSMLFVALVMATLLSEAPVRYALLGVTLGLLFLSRLDNVFLAGCVLAGLWLRDRNGRVVLAGAICAAIGGVYLAFNLHEFGHLMPISGAIKSAVYRQHFFSGQLGTNGMLSLAGAVGLAVRNILHRSGSGRYRIAALVLSCGVILQSVYVMALTYGDTTWVWYYVQGYLCIALLFAEFVDSLASAARVPLGSFVFVLVLAFSMALVAAKYLVGWAWHDRHLRGDLWRDSWIADVERVTGADHNTLIVFDQPGLFAYRLSNPVFALDGLTSNYRLEAEIATKGMYSELAQLGNAYFLGPVVKAGESLDTAVTLQTGGNHGQVIHFSTPLTGADAGCIYVDNSGLLLSRPVPSTLIGGVWGLWRLTPETMRPIDCRAGQPSG
jgi:hypothetical protein